MAKKATLYGPGGKREVVEGGSKRASQLQSQGWGLKPGSYRDPKEKKSAKEGTRHVGPKEYEKLRKEFGVSDKNFDKYFVRRDDGIYVKEDTVTKEREKKGKAPGSKQPSQPQSPSPSAPQIPDDREPLFQEPTPTAEIPTPVIEPTPAAPDPYEELLNQLEGQLAALIEEGNMINPEIEITSELAQQFLTQASTELDPYYQELTKNSITEFQRSAEESRRQLEFSEEDTIKEYQKSLEQTGEASAEEGNVYSGTRQEKEQKLSTDTQRLVDERRRQLQFNLSQQFGGLEKSLGSSSLTGLSPFGFSRTLSFVPGQRDIQYGQGESSLYSLTGGIVGALEKERETEVQRRQAELEGSYRQQRSAEIYADYEKKKSDLESQIEKTQRNLS